VSSRPRRGAPLFAALALLLLALAPGASGADIRPLSSFGGFGTDAGQLREPAGIAVGADGSVYVADTLNDRVDVFSREGVFQRAFGKGVNATDGSDVCTALSGCRFGPVNSTAGALRFPQGIAVGPDGMLYVSESDGARISVFTPAGTFLRAFGKHVNAGTTGDVCTAATGCASGTESGEAGAMNEPLGIGFDAAGELLVADSANNRVDVFSPEGTFLRAFGKEVDPRANADVCATECRVAAATLVRRAMSGPADVVEVFSRLLAVSDRANHRIDVFASVDDGFVRAIGSGVDPAGSDVCTTTCLPGVGSTGASGFGTPTGLAATAAGLLVADRADDRVSEIGLDGRVFRVFGEGVIDGAAAFQVCTVQTGCRAGGTDGIPGSVIEPLGIAAAPQEQVLVSEQREGFARIERLGSVGPPVPPPPPTGEPSNAFSLGRVSLDRRRGTATLSVNLPSPGSLVLRGKGVRPVDRQVAAAGVVRLTILPSAATRRLLSRRGRASVRVVLTFTPSGGSARSQARAVTLRRQVRPR